MTERDLQKACWRMRARPMSICNQYLFKWESDFLEIRKTGFTAEFEIKLSRSDFKAEKNKSEKFFILENGYRVLKSSRAQKDENGRFVKDELGAVKYVHSEKQLAARRPNYFSYVVPEGLITADEVPTYAGLYYAKEYKDTMEGSNRTILREIKSPKRLHNAKYSLWKELAKKFYFGGYEKRYFTD